MMKKLITLICCHFFALLSACAFDIVHIEQIPIEIESSQAEINSFILANEANINIGSGYSRALRQGTKWDYVGKISYGDVYRTSDQVLTIEASNIHEAYIVISNKKLVGFYLPVEHSFSPLSSPIELNIRKM